MEQKVFKTNDLYLAAFLQSRGFSPLTHLNSNGMVEFCFPIHARIVADEFQSAYFIKCLKDLKKQMRLFYNEKNGRKKY